MPLGSAAAVKRDSRNVAGSRDGAEGQTERDWRVAAGVAGLGWGGQCSGHCGRRRWRIACPHSDGASRPTLPVCPTGQETGRRRALWGSPREQSQDDPVTSRKVSASPGRKSDMRFSLTAPSPESTLTRVRAHAYTHADRPRDAGTRGGKGASPPACATAVRAQTPGVRTGPGPRRATRSGGGEGVGGVRGPKTARGIIGFLMGLLSSCGVGENQKGAERWQARLWIGVGCVHVEPREIRQWE